MINTHRNRVAGGSYFFTVTLINRQSRVLTNHADLLRTAFRETQCRHPFVVDAFVILPEHLHTIWTLPPGDADCSGRWRTIKSCFTRALHKTGKPFAPYANGNYTLWQQPFWEHTIRDKHDLRRHVDYIHYNPIRHGYVSKTANWPYSSFHRYVKQGLLAEDWAGGRELQDGKFGE